MSRASLIVLFAALIAVSPFLGLPYSWLMVLEPVLGGLIAILAFTGRERTEQRSDEYGGGQG